MSRTIRRTLALSLAVLTALTLVGYLLVFSPSPAHGASSHIRPAVGSPVFPHVQNAQLYDGSGNPLYLRGAMIDSNLAYYSNWPTDVNLALSEKTFQTMHDVWGMNAIRINISYWLYTDTNQGQLYKDTLKNIVALANEYGLYVILDFHSDKKAAPNPNPGTPADGRLYQSEVNWWISLATQPQYKSNTMLLFDLINEPKYGSWTAWSTTNGSIIGVPQAITQLRTAGVLQPIVVEPGDAAKQGGSQDSGWQNYSTSWITDTNILYSKHEYAGITKTQLQFPGTAAWNQWDLEWGPLVDQQTHIPLYALYFGEWSVEASRDCVSSNGTSEPTSSDAIALTTNFLNYLQARNIHWTAYNFGPDELLQGPGNMTAYTNYTPTTFDVEVGWTCGNLPSGDQHIIGQGTQVQSFLLNANNQFSTKLANDDFNRHDQTLWGNSSFNNIPWAGDAATNTRFSIVSMNGQVTNGGGTSLMGELGTNAPNEEVFFSGSMTKFTTTGSPERLGAVLRFSDANDFYYAYIDGTNLFISKKVTGTTGETVLASATPAFTASANTSYSLRFRVANNTLVAKAWVTGSTEPPFWMVTATDTSLQGPGQCGVRLLLQNTTPTATYTKFTAVYL